MDVLAELRYEPSVKITDIGVLVKDGAVTLNGYATNYCEKCDAVRAAKKIRVETSANKVVLGGTVRNYFEREEAERVAWAAPGVYSVENQLKVEWPWRRAE